MVVCAYDDHSEMITLANSWGEKYGDSGYNHVPYQYLAERPFDAWTAGFDELPDAKKG
jgi:C1A family cysteine protease